MLTQTRACEDEPTRISIFALPAAKSTKLNLILLPRVLRTTQRLHVLLPVFCFFPSLDQNRMVAIFWHTGSRRRSKRDLWIRTTIKTPPKRKKQPFSRQKDTAEAQQTTHNAMWSRSTSSTRPTEHSHSKQCGVEPPAAHVLYEQHTTERSTLIQNNVESNQKQRKPVTSSTQSTEHSPSKQCGVRPQAAHTLHEQHTPNGAISFKTMWSRTTINARPSRAAHA